MELSEAISSDRATRSFADEPVTDDDLEAVLDHARRAGSGKNTQPWELIVVRERDRLEELSAFGTYTSPLADCGAGILLVVDADVSHGAQRMNAFDCGRFAQNLMLAATDRGMGTVPQGLPDSDDLRAFLELPDDREVLLGIALGHPAETDEDRIEGEEKESVLASMGRKDLDELVHWERY